MAQIRSLLFFLWMAITVVPWALAVVVASWFVKGRPLYWMCANWLGVSIWGARLICGVRWRVHGMEHLPSAADTNAAVLLAPKHQSAWETFAFPMLMPHPLAYVFKRELLMIPFFGWAIGRLDMIHIDRSQRAAAWRKVSEQGREYMSRGSWVIMFPEGTRIARGEVGEYKTGASRLAIAAGVPIVPIAVTSAKCWPRKSFVLRPGVIDVSIGRPIPSQGRRPDELMQEVQVWIETEMHRLDPAAYPASAAPHRHGGSSDPGMNEGITADLFGELPSPLHYRHPRATREIRLGEHHIGFELRRARRRTIGFVVAAEGLTVSAPRWVSLADIDAGVREKAAWILRKLAQMREQARRQQAARIEWFDGTTVPYLGRRISVRLDPTARYTRFDDAASLLRLALPADARAEPMREAVQAWLKREARRVFEARVAHYMPRLRVTVSGLALSSAATRWGSASSNGKVRLNWRLVHLTLTLIDYVVVHELAHLRHMDHSPRFWSVVGAELPDYLAQRAALKSESVPTL